MPRLVQDLAYERRLPASFADKFVKPMGMLSHPHEVFVSCTHVGSHFRQDAAGCALMPGPKHQQLPKQFSQGPIASPYRFHRNPIARIEAQKVESAKSS